MKKRMAFRHTGVFISFALARNGLPRTTGG
jgi:hypothetical protein